jgi:hypothetical protein
VGKIIYAVNNWRENFLLLPVRNLKPVEIQPNISNNKNNPKGYDRRIKAGNYIFDI